MSRGATGARQERGVRRGLAAVVFPEVPREFPARRGIKMTLRAAHVLSSGVLCGAYLLGAGAADRTTWLLATAITGLLILLVDLHESGVFLLQVRGLVVLAKIGLLAALPHLGEYAGWVLAAVVIVSVYSSHASSKIRYFVVLRRAGITGASTKG